ncbi:non-ribosomal peptide synthetase [Paenibacillus bouchesdurhonensis]|uniref:non-ribosomal peptide synthetase n=1 Tax=Paenibacillus bouchesdurhonensis TaxID=1870990 RepID=UPI000DA5F029|nr:non-ribosomal peptide synthetase [Paenibacillus bouchesdurhonensis]
MINAQSVEDIYALSPVQEGLLFHYLKDEGSMYNIQLVICLDGSLNVQLVKKCWGIMVRKHATLRSVYNWDKTSKNLQIVLNEYEPEFACIALPDQQSGAGSLEEYLRIDRSKRFDLRRPPYRLAIVKDENHREYFIITNHHILFDGWSSSILMRDFISIYSRLYRGEGIEPPAKHNIYKHFVQFCLYSDDRDASAFWSRHLDGYDYFIPKNSNDHHRFEEQRLILPQQQIHDFLKQEGLTLAALLYGVWGIVQQKLHRRKDILIGTTVSGRNAPISGIEDLVGLCINTVPLRIKAASDLTVKSLLQKVMSDLAERMPYESNSLTSIMEAGECSGNYTLFDSIVVVENYPVMVSEAQGFPPFDYYTCETNNYELTLGVEQTRQNELVLILSYNNAKYSSDQANTLGEVFLAVLSQMLGNAEQKISSISMMTKTQESAILQKYGADGRHEPETVEGFFVEAASAFPDKIAVSCGEHSLTYDQLNKKSNQLARVLIKRGIKENSIVAVLFSRSVELVVAIVAVIKSGGAFVLIDPELPAERKNHILNDSNAQLLLLSDNGMAEELKYEGSIYPFSCNDPIDELDVDVSVNILPEHLLYVIYTSGTTGLPQGVMIEHGNLYVYMKSYQELFGITEQDTTIQLSPVTFDLFIEQLCLALFFGGTLIIPESTEYRNMEQLHRIITEQKVTLLTCSPQVLKIFNTMPPMPSVRLAISGGDVMKYEYISNLNKYMEVYNGYGPTEATIGATFYRLPKKMEKEIPIGKPISNYGCMILDQDGHQVPDGILGELYISGGGLGRGYINNAELTNKRFAWHPIQNKQERLYKTGDLVVRHRDGNIHFVGREDSQVKLNGIRLETREIEIYLNMHSSIEDSVVLALSDAEKNSSLCAFYVSRTPLTEKELREYLSKYLHTASLPTHFFHVDAIPMTRHDKTDVRQLTKYFHQAMENKKDSVIPMKSASERILHKIWSEVLNKPAIGPHDDFFEIGGNSIHMMSIFTKINQSILDANVTIQNLFDYRTISELAEFIDRKSIQQPEKTEVDVIDF